MARLSSELVLSLTDRVSGPARAVGRSMQQLNGGVRAAAKAQVGYLADVAGAAAILGPAAAAFAAQKTIVAAADFESALTGIQKKAGTTAAQTKALGDEIKALATSGDLAVPIEEIAAAYERGAAAGLPLDELRQFATLSAKAADSFDMAAADVGNAAAGFKVGLGIPMEEMERYFDLINGLADTGIADESDLINFLDRSGAALKQFGLSAQEAAAYAATMLNLKMAPDVGANALATLTGKLLSPGSPKAQKALAGIVGNTRDFTKLLKSDANGAVLKFLDSINRLDKFKATQLLGEFVGDGFDDEVLRLAKGVEEARKNLQYAAGTDWFGSLDASYKLKLDDMWSQWQLLKNDMSKLMIDIGTAGMPALQTGLEGAKSLVDQIGQGFERFKLTLDMDEIGEAGTAIANLGDAITKLIGIDTSKAAIPKFMEEMADAANDIAGAINAVDRFFRKPIENWGNETVTPEKQAALKAMQPEEQYDSGGTLTYRGWLQAKRARDLAGKKGAVPGTMSPDPANIPAVNASSTPSRNAVAERRRAQGPQGPVQPRDGFGGFGPQLPAIPAPRPNIAAGVQAETDAATAIAVAGGQKISDALSVTATPVVSTSSLDAFIAKTAAAKAALAELGAVADSVNARFGSAASRADMDGIHADTTHPGF